MFLYFTLQSVVLSAGRQMKLEQFLKGDVFTHSLFPEPVKFDNENHVIVYTCEPNVGFYCACVKDITASHIIIEDTNANSITGTIIIHIKALIKS